MASRSPDVTFIIFTNTTKNRHLFLSLMDIRMKRTTVVHCGIYNNIDGYSPMLIIVYGKIKGSKLYTKIDGELTCRLCYVWVLHKSNMIRIMTIDSYHEMGNNLEYRRIRQYYMYYEERQF